MSDSTPSRRLLPVNAGEVRALLWAAGYYFCILFAYYLIRPYRDEMGIRGDLDKLPWLWTGTTVATFIGAGVYAWVVSRMPRRRFIPVTYLFFAAVTLVFYGLFLAFPAKGRIGIGYAFYIWVSVFNLFITTVFWGFMTDVFSKEQGKRLFGAIGVGGTLGTICGSSVPATLVGGVEIGGRVLKIAPVQLLPMSAVLLVLAVGCVWRLVRLFGLVPGAPAALANPDTCTACGYALKGLPVRDGVRTCPECGAIDRRPVAGYEPGRGVFTGLVLIARSPYLLLLCGYMLLFTITGAFLSFEQARIVKANFPEAAQRVQYLARIDLSVNILTLATQVFLTGWILTRLGVMTGLLILPIVTVLGFGALGAQATPAVLMAVLIARRGLHYAVDRPTREVLYTVLGPEEKYKSKSFIDTFVYRGGDVVGAWSDYFLTKAGVLVALPAIAGAALWAVAGGALGIMNRRVSARPRA